MRLRFEPDPLVELEREPRVIDPTWKSTAYPAEQPVIDPATAKKLVRLSYDGKLTPMEWRDFAGLHSPRLTAHG